MTSTVKIPDRLYFRIGDVAELADVKPHVLRYWETEFSVIQPQKSSAGQRVYRRSDVETVLLIKHLLYQERYSIEGARQRLRELRKDGELKKFKNVVLAPQASSEFDQAREQSLKQLRTVAHELRTLARAPLREIFKY